MLEKLRNDGALELLGIFHDKGLTILGPASDRGITGINHMVGFCSWRVMEREASCEYMIGINLEDKNDDDISAKRHWSWTHTRTGIVKP